MKPYLVCGMLHFNEEFFSRHCIGALYQYINEFIIVDSYSTDKSLDIIKKLDSDNKVTIIKRKWDNNYSNARNTYLEYIKKNIWPKYRNNLYYLRTDFDEIYFETWIKNAINEIEENPEIEGWRSNFYTFTEDLNHLDEKNPTETRVSLFKYSPDIEYRNPLHEMPVHKNSNTPLYGSPFEDKLLGIKYLPGYSYCHYTWCGNMEREFVKAVNYEKHYLAQGRSTKEKLDTMTQSKDSWWWDKSSKIKYKGLLPNIFHEFGLLSGQEIPDNNDGRTKISAYTLIKNSILYNYPVIEAIQSVLPIVDEFIINCGDSEDGTTGLIRKAFEGIDKVKIFERIWDGRDKGTLFLRKESNWAKEQCSNEICLYVQSDEIYSEEDYDKILLAAKTLEERKDLAGAIMKYEHYDGDFGSVNPDSYQREVRMVKKNLLDSIGDAQSFGLRQANLNNVMAFPQILLETDITTFHIGWVREPKKMLSKLVNFDKFYHTDEEVVEMHKNDLERHKDGEYNYGSRDKHIESKRNLPYVLYPRVQSFERNYPSIIKNKGKFNE